MGCIGSNDEEAQEQTLQQQLDAFETDRFVATYESEEGKYRLENAEEIMNKRWQWYKNNQELFTLILQRAGFELEDIKQSMDGTKPLGMKTDFYNETMTELIKSVKAVEKRITSETGNEFKLRIVLQGSYVVGYGSNPRKGERYIPTYLFNPKKKSDYDFRCYGDGLDAYVEQLRNDGTEIDDRGESGKPHIIKPYSVGKIFPEFDQLCEDFLAIAKKYVGKEVRLQVSCVTQNIGFEPGPWDLEIDIE